MNSLLLLFTLTSVPTFAIFDHDYGSPYTYSTDYQYLSDNDRRLFADAFGETIFYHGLTRAELQQVRYLAEATLELRELQQKVGYGTKDPLNAHLIKVPSSLAPTNSFHLLHFPTLYEGLRKLALNRLVPQKENSTYSKAVKAIRYGQYKYSPLMTPQQVAVAYVQVVEELAPGAVRRFINDLRH